ncbi:hypothetical protein CcaverHIS002_0111890 [Cutaneotrichosporon cavernicola]|nr:hypothetical protein CcaverHIS002_0111890 [Cutaneotrichosporon cavernicola]
MPGKDTSSSSGKIFAKPSKEWVLPERAKPGRKASTQEPESKRQSQNRMSQRAHRARRTDYIQTLEERLRQYEANEIHSNVRLQEVARALKADNDKLRSEVSALGSAIAAARKEREGWSAERRALNDTMRALRTQLNAARRSSSTGPSPRLDDRLEFELAALARSPALTPALSPLAATPRHAATPPFVSRPVTQQPDSLMCPICPDPDPDCPCQRPPSPVTTLPAPEPIPPLQTLDSQLARTQRGTDLTLLQATTTLVASANCGMCDMSSLDCVCNEPEIEDIKPVIPPLALAPARHARDHGHGLRAMHKQLVLCVSGRIGLAPAVPLRLRARAAAKQSVWKLDNVPAGQSRAEAVCTGDPSNCDACRNDRFGQEFCGHLFGVNDADNDNDKDKGDQKKGCAGCTKGKCGGDKGPLTARSMSISSLMDGPVPSPSTSAPATPGPVGDAPLVLTCCGAPELCGHAAGCDDSMPVEEETKPTPDETIRPDQAWKQLKAHPNAQFTPLAVLADVVARRTRCDGPRVELSPPPDERGLADARATLASHASKRRLAVETSAVRDALKYLDTHPHSAPGSPMSPAAKRRRML